MTPCNVLLHADDEVGRWICSRIANTTGWINGVGRAIGFTYGERLIAGVAYFGYNTANIEVAFASEHPRWMSRDNFWRICEYPFGYLKLRRVTAIVDETNHASRKLIEAFGFSLEATLKQAAPDGDQLLYRMFREDCKWLH